MNVLITGASGFLGSAVRAQLERHGHRIATLSRRTGWDALATEPAKEVVTAVGGSDAVIHLAGENIASGRWTDKRKRLIKDTRVNSTRQLANAINTSGRTDLRFFCASAIGYYGDAGGDMLDESSPPGHGFLSNVCKAWEEAANFAPCKVVNLRFGVILSLNGGALPKMLRPFRFGLGGKIGTGEQWMSWISLQDAVAAIDFLMERKNAVGRINVVAPNPVTNSEFTRVAARALNKPAILNVPKFAIRLALGEMGAAVLLNSQRVAPKRLLETNFRFSKPSLESLFAGRGVG